MVAARLACHTIIAATLVLACAGAPTGPLFSPAPPPAPGRALVYVYRVDRVGGVGPIKLRIDGRTSIELRNGEYAPLVLRSGGRKLELTLPLLGSVPRGWSSIPFMAMSGETHFVRIWAGMEEVVRGPQGRPDDFGAPGRSNRYANVNVFGAVWATAESESDIRDLQLAPGVPKDAL